MINRFISVTTQYTLAILLYMIDFRFIIVSKVKLPTVVEGSLFNSYYTEVYGRALLLSLDCSTLPLIRTLYCWVLSKEVSSTILKVFGMTLPRTEPRFPGPLVNTLPTKPMSSPLISFWGSFWIRMVFLLAIQSGIFFSSRHLHSWRANLWISKTRIPVYHHVLAFFQHGTLLCVALRDSWCVWPPQGPLPVLVILFPCY